MKTIRERFARCLFPALTGIFLAVSFDFGESAMGAPATTTTIRYTGTDFEGRQNFQISWSADGAGTYLVQSADDLSSNSWNTIDMVTSSNAGPVKWEAPESLHSRKFYRLVLPQPEIFSVEPGVLNTTVSNQYLYILGQDLPTNADIVIDGLHFTPEIINSNGVWARILLNGLPPGEPVADLTVIDNGTGTAAADFPDPFLTTDSSFPYLFEPPEQPPAGPEPQEAKGIVGIKPAGSSGHASSGRTTAAGGEDCDDTDPGVMPFSGEVQARAMDMRIPGRGLDFVWVRTYRSRSASTDGTAGTRWTSSYNVSVQPLGGDVVIHDGTGRADTYYLQTNGTYACPGFFREGTLSNNVFRLAFADGGIWVFNPLDGTSTAGLLANIMNGNGDVISLYYDSSGRLAQVVDDLGRTNTVSYNSDGQLSAITDFSGRAVTYAYYQSGETGGSPRDLKSVTSPPVTGTPNGNDFPDGKTTTYTYSSGYKNDLENHLLLSVTDPLGQTVSQFIYQHNQTDLEFLHCISIQRGTNTPAMFSYLPQIPSPTNQFATVRCIANDPEGDVAEFCFDARNRCLNERDFTGRAVPGVKVTDTLNRPTGKLRPADPDVYETDWTWNDDSLCTLEVEPDGSSSEMIYQRAFNQNSSRTNHTHANLHDGDLRVLHEYTANGVVVDLDGDGIGDTSERVWRFEYDPRFGSDPTAKPGKKLYVGNLPFTESPSANMRDRVNALEQVLKNCDLSASARGGRKDMLVWVPTTGHGRINNLIMPEGNGVAINTKGTGADKNRVSGGKGWDGTIKGLIVPEGNGVAIKSKGTGADKNRVTGGKGWDGTIKGGLALTDCDDNDPKRHHPTADTLLNNFVTSVQDPRGIVTTATYDPAGNCLHVTRSAADPDSDLDFTYNAFGQLTSMTNAPDANGYRRVDTFTYYTSGPQAGYLQSIAIDESGTHLTTTFETDARGNVTRCIDPRGNDWLYTYNALDQCVQIQSPVNVKSRCATDIYYDAADNVQATIEEVRDDTDARVGSKTVLRGYDRSHRLTRIAYDVDPAHAMTNDFVYDGNDRCILALGGDAVSGADPYQAIAYQYDERGLLFREITAPGSPLAGTNEINYTADYKPATKRYEDGFDLRVCSYTYDGFNRLASVTDAMGNRADCFFDADDNLKKVRCFGETNDVPGSGGNIRLAETRYDYDALDRCVRVHELHFDPATQAPIGDGENTTSYGYAPNDECISRTNDLSHVTTFGYDTAGRLNLVASPEERTSFGILLDPNGNPTTCSETDLSDLGGAPQVFTESYAYDSLGRCINAADNVGNTTSYSYDSLNRCVETVDPRGVHSFYSYDLLGRCTAAIGDLDGDGSPDFTGDITETATWSSSSDRVLSLTDSHTNMTSYAYDTLGNCTTVSYADGTHCSLIWSPRSNLILYQDANGSVTSNSYDLDDRVIHRDIAARTVAGVAATTTFETYTYDGCSRLTSHHDDDGDGYLSYDSLGNCLRETLNGLPTTSTYDALGNRLSLAGPGGRTFSYTYDVLERCSSVSESGKSQATYSYDGPDRISRVSLGNNTVTRIFYDGIAGQPNSPGDRGWQQIARVAHGLNGGSAFVDSSFQYDPDQNKIYRAIFIPGGTTHTNAMSLQYDRASRLTESLVTDDSTLIRDTIYGLDRMGNRTNVAGAACSGAYVLDSSALGPLDFQMNQYTATPCDTRTYDDNGNLISRNSSAGVTNYVYDAEDRLVSVQTLDFSSGTGMVVPVADYRYDALGRRISRTVYSGGTSNVIQYCYDGTRAIEERQNGTVLGSYLVDDRHLLGLRVMGKDYYLHCDDQGNTLALTDPQGGVVERYLYDDYGTVTFLAGDGTPTGATSSAYDNAYLFGGLRYDAESGLDCDDGDAYLESASGRYLIRSGVPLRADAGAVLDSRGIQARHGSYVSGRIGQNNPWSGGGGGGGGGAGGTFSEQHRDYLYSKFQDGDIPAGNDRLARPILKSFFEKGDKPTQAQFGALIDSVSGRFFETGDIPTEDQFAGEVKVEKIKFKQEFGPTQANKKN